MHFNKKLFITLFSLFSLLTLNTAFSKEIIKPTTKYPDYAYSYLGQDKFENFNRKMFAFNLKLNKFVVKPIHILWASVMPQYGMDRIKSACNNIEFPIRVTSCLIQKDFKASGHELIRFLTNSTIGLGGLYDPAAKIFKIKQVNEDMEQALCKCHVKSGPYLVVPFLASTTPRDLIGKALDLGLNPSSYVALPVVAIAKAGLTINKTSDIQHVVKMLEDDYADSYLMAREFYGFNNYIKNSNLDRDEVLSSIPTPYTEDNTVKVMPTDSVANTLTPSATNIPTNSNTSETALKLNDIIKAGNNADSAILKSYDDKNSKLMADMMLFDYHAQCPVTDAMRTALFDSPEVNKSFWNEFSLWNRCFEKQIKVSYINIYPKRADYKFRYIMQKDKNSPVAIIYPSIGEGAMTHHSTILAKIFYDEGYSVIIQGSSFNWEFIKSMEKGFIPGIPANDAEYLRLTTSKIIDNLQKKYNCQFKNKVLIGTSFGAETALFLANKEYKNNTLNIDKYIAINPPVKMVYSMHQIDKNSEDWDKDSVNFKNKSSYTAAKVLKIYKDKTNFKPDTLPFTEEEAKLITGFVMHQKLADTVFTIEDTCPCKKCSIYNQLYNMSYEDYANKYLLTLKNYKTTDEMDYETSLYAISDFLQNSNNYKIYHSIDDYLVNHDQLKDLKKFSQNKLVLLSNGSHLGFLYREEFLQELKKDIALGNIKTAQK